MADPVINNDQTTAIVKPVPQTEPTTPRQEIISKYETLYGQPPSEPQQSGATGDTPAQGDSTPQQEPQTSVSPSTSDSDAEVENFFKGLITELQTVKQELAALKNQQPKVEPQAQTPPPTPTQEERGRWLQLLAEGKIVEAEEEMKKALGVKPVDEAEIYRKASQQAIEQMEARRRIGEITMNFRQSNQDIAELEPFIAARLDAGLRAEYEAGNIKSTEDYVKAFETNLKSLVDEARKIVQKTRASGAEQTLTVKQQVLSSQTVPPQSVSNREPQPEEVKIESAQDYLQARKMRQMQQRGMA